MAKTTKQTKCRSRPVRLERRVRLDAADRLLRAVAAWVKEAGGCVVVAGGIRIETWPGDLPHNFVVGVKCTGTKPVKPNAGVTGAKKMSTVRRGIHKEIY